MPYGKDIMTRRFQDLVALGKLQKHIKSNREAAGLCPVLDKDMSRLHLVADATTGSSTG